MHRIITKKCKYLIIISWYNVLTMRKWELTMSFDQQVNSFPKLLEQFSSMCFFLQGYICPRIKHVRSLKNRESEMPRLGEHSSEHININLHVICATKHDVVGFCVDTFWWRKKGNDLQTIGMLYWAGITLTLDYVFRLWPIIYVYMDGITLHTHLMFVGWNSQKIIEN